MPWGLAGATAGKVSLCSGQVFLSHWRRRDETVWPTSAVEKWLMVHQRLLQSGPWGTASVWCLSPGCGGANAKESLKDHGMVEFFCLFVFVCLFYFFPCGPSCLFRQWEVLVFKKMSPHLHLWNYIVKEVYFCQPGWAKGLEKWVPCKTVFA